MTKKDDGDDAKGLKYKVSNKKKTIIQITAYVGVAFIFLVAGISVGNGTVQFGNGSLLRLSSQNTNNLPPTLNYAVVQQEYNILKNNYDGKLNTNQLQDGVMSGLASATGDPFTEYFNASQSKDFNDELNNTFSGIGAVLSENSKSQIVVVSPLSGYPAANAGVKAQDIILSVNGKSTIGQNVDSVVNEIRGPDGSYVTLGIQRGNQPELTFKIKREQITAPSVISSTIDGNIGYIQIISFANDTSTLAQQAATTLKNEGVKGIILDLRNNPGGLVSAAVNVSSLWLPPGDTILVEKHDNKAVNTYTSTGSDILNGIPTVVLINGGSASASEITAAALHDNKAATTMGEKSYGKGTAQNIYPLSNGGEIKVTIIHWYTPDGVSIEYKGIKPDISVSESASDQATGTDTQKNAAIQYLQTH